MIKKKYRTNKPELKNLLTCRSSSSSNLQVTISRVGEFVFKGRPKRKIRPTLGLLSSRKPIIFSFFFFVLNGPGRTVMCSLYIYTSQYLTENFTVRCIIFSLRTDIEKQTITFFATNNYNPIFHYKYKLNTALYNFFSLKKGQTRARKADESARFRIEANSFIF